MKVKIITGFREDQYQTIDVEEAHKAYYLFLHPNERGIFSNGVALIGSDIREIKPDYNATMGWNPTYELGDDDWVEIRKMGIDKKLQNALGHAKRIANLPNPPVNLTLTEAIKLLPDQPKEISDAVKKLADSKKV